MHRYANWRQALHTAPNLQAVHELVTNYIVAIRPIFEVLPPECRAALSGIVDIQSAAVTLLQAEIRFTGPREVQDLLHEIAHTFATAAVRVAQLQAGLQNRT